MVRNVGRGETSCSGGGICLFETPADLDIAYNIIANNREGGLVCDGGYANATLGPNLFWYNINGNFGCYAPDCLYSWRYNQIIEVPQFCDETNDNYTVAVGSPALAGPVPMGVWTSPGCGPGVAVERTTWGQIKARYD